MIIIPIKWLFFWEYTLFSDKPISWPTYIQMAAWKMPLCLLISACQFWLVHILSVPFSLAMWNDAGCFATFYMMTGDVAFHTITIASLNTLSDLVVPKFFHLLADKSSLCEHVVPKRPLENQGPATGSCSPSSCHGWLSEKKTLVPWWPGVSEIMPSPFQWSFML
jgi:hypothetical protein